MLYRKVIIQLSQFKKTLNIKITKKLTDISIVLGPSRLDLQRHPGFKPPRETTPDVQDAQEGYLKLKKWSQKVAGFTDSASDVMFVHTFWTRLTLMMVYFQIKIFFLIR